MTGLFKHILWIAPVAALVIALSFFLNRENHEEMKSIDAEFNRDWNEAQQSFARNDPAQAAKHAKRAEAAQRQYSSSVATLTVRQKQMESTEADINKAMKSFEEGQKK